MIQRKSQRRPAKKKPETPQPAIHNRVAVDPPVGARVAIGTITDPFGMAELMPKQSKQRRDGSQAPGEGEWVSPGQPKIVVLRSIRTDPLGWLHSHSLVGEPEYLAGRHWQMLHERSQIGSVQAVDTSKEPVDGGKIPEIVTDGQRIALAALRRAAGRLANSCKGDRPRGMHRVALILAVLADGKFMRQIAAERGFRSKGAIAALSREFKRSLGVLALEFGLASVPRQKAKIVGVSPKGMTELMQKQERQKNKEQEKNAEDKEETGRIWKEEDRQDHHVQEAGESRNACQQSGIEAHSQAEDQAGA